MNINARTNAPIKVAAGEKARSVAKLKKNETAVRKPTKMKSVIRIVASIVPLSWLRLPI